MWSGLFTLLLLSIVMAAASYGAGILPLSLTLSPRHLRLITALGTGILVGTSLIVIIPEGVETLYSASGSTQGHVRRSVATGPHSHSALWTTSPALSMEKKDSMLRNTWYQTRSAAEEDDPAADQPKDEPVNHNEDQKETYREPHAYVGLALISGFILMYLIDTVPQHATTSSQPQRFHVNLNQFSFNRSDSVSSEPPETPTRATTSPINARPSSTTIGLVIHATADGIALGASSTTTSRLTIIIFIALMIHKAPAAFGLTSVLLKQGVSKRAARNHLIVFALAAPAGAIITWFAAHLLGYSSSSNSSEFATGMLLLFSGGTFLYVAMHTMQEGDSHTSEGAAQGNGYAGLPSHEVYGETGATPQKEQKTLTDTLVVVGGMLLPLLTQVGHAH